MIASNKTGIVNIYSVYGFNSRNKITIEKNKTMNVSKKYEINDIYFTERGELLLAMDNGSILVYYHDTDNIEFVIDAHLYSIGNISKELSTIYQEDAASLGEANLKAIEDVKTKRETVQINTLDNRIIYIAIDEIINPKTVKIVKGEGMPLYRKEVSVNEMDVKKGDLFIKFNIVFPEVIDPEKKERIIKLLNNDEN